MKSIVHGRPKIFPDKIGKRNHLALDNLPVFLKDFLKEGDAVLFKGSRGMKLEELVEGLM